MIWCLSFSLYVININILGLDGVVRICGKNKYFNSGKFVFEKLLNLGKRKKDGRV